MILAAVAFGDPLMLAGLAAALVPVVLHLLNRMNAPVMAFPTLRFLKITAHKTAAAAADSAVFSAAECA